MPGSKKTIPLHLHISTLFSLLILCFSLLAGFLQLRSISQILLTEAHLRFQQMAQSSEAALRNLYQPAVTLDQSLASFPLVRATSTNERLDSLPWLTNSLAGQPSLSAAYVGYENGDFFLVRPWNEQRPSATLRTRYAPPAGTRWIVQSIEHLSGETLRQLRYFDTHLQLIELRNDPDQSYDPRNRDWYQGAGSKLTIGKAYTFRASQNMGITMAIRTRTGSVAGVDIEFGEIAAYLQKQPMTPDSRVALLSDNHTVLALIPGLQRHLSNWQTQAMRLDQLPMPMLHRLLADTGLQMDRSYTFTVNGEDWEGQINRISLPGNVAVTLLMAMPHSELLAEVSRLRMQGLAISLLLLVSGIAAAILLSRLASRPLQALQDESRRIEHFDFSSPIRIQSRITEVQELTHAMDRMKGTIRRFLELSSNLASESNFHRLLSGILNDLTELAMAEGGCIYLLDSSQQTLHPEHGCWQGKILAQEEHAPAVAIADETHPIALAARSGSIQQQVDAASLHALFRLQGQSAMHCLLAVPLKDRQGHVIGVISLLRQGNEIDSALQALVEALSGTAAVAIESRRLIFEQKRLLESFIKLLAGAIDAKSPYTGGHCARVPVLARMLTEAAQRSQNGPFADFHLDENQWEALHIAAWLHDCGKITTPEYVVDKATRLETLYDRIHEIRMRFEVLKRDAQINALQQKLAGGDAPQIDAELSNVLAQLDEEFAFIARCNQGSESGAAEVPARLQQIASRRWLRTLSDRIGISHEELQRKGQEPEPQLPIWEPLLADKPEHRLPRASQQRLPEGYGFLMDEPELLYHRGELYNLGIRYGTLTGEERYKINEHIVQTIVMLNKLPFPRHLQDVPEIAGGHHEKLDGTGYPRKLKKADMSIQARIMAIADIFEALTAIDRPYKEGKTLSQALAIMQRMAAEQHIDAELFRLFVESGVYLEYARQYMRPAQIDTVDTAALLAS